MVCRRSLPALTLASLVLAGCSSESSSPGAEQTPNSPAVSAVQSVAGDVFAEALAESQQRPGCRDDSEVAKLSDAAVPSEIARLVAAFRRPQTAAEKKFAQAHIDTRNGPGGTVYVRSVRRVGADDGTSLALFVARRDTRTEPAGCPKIRRELAAADLDKRSADAATRRQAEALLDNIDRGQREIAAKTAAKPGIVLATPVGNPRQVIGAEPGTPPASLAAKGDWSAGDRGKPPAEVTGLLPDGVKTVKVTFRGGLTRTVPVRENVAHLRVPLDAPAAQVVSQEWTTADGSTIKRK